MTGVPSFSYCARVSVRGRGVDGGITAQAKKTFINWLQLISGNLLDARRGNNLSCCAAAGERVTGNSAHAVMRDSSILLACCLPAADVCWCGQHGRHGRTQRDGPQPPPPRTEFRKLRTSWLWTPSELSVTRVIIFEFQIIEVAKYL